MTTKSSKPFPWLTLAFFALVLGIVVLGFVSQRQAPPSATAAIEAPANYDGQTWATIEEAARHCPGDVTRIAGPVDAPARYGCARDTSRRFGGS